MSKCHNLTRGLCFALLLSAGTQLQAGDPLAKVHTVRIQYQANTEIKGCEAAMANALAAHGIGVTNAATRANADFKLKLDVKAGAMRTTLNWGALVEDFQGNRLYSNYGEESGWSALAACEDLADDLAEDLQDDIRNARLLSF